MSLECGDCERDLRAGHAPGCPRLTPEAAPKRIPARLPIPIRSAESIGRRFGYDQVVVFGRRVSDDPKLAGEHMTTWGRNRDHCQVAKHIGNTLKDDVMKWPSPRAEAIADLISRRGDWKTAVEAMIVQLQANGEECSYWQHQLDVLDRIETQLRSK